MFNPFPAIVTVEIDITKTLFYSSDCYWIENNIKDWQRIAWTGFLVYLKNRSLARLGIANIIIYYFMLRLGLGHRPA